jgi:hypothetical protein
VAVNPTYDAVTVNAEDDGVSGGGGDLRPRMNSIMAMVGEQPYLIPVATSGDAGIAPYYTQPTPLGEAEAGANAARTRTGGNAPYYTLPTPLDESGTAAGANLNKTTEYASFAPYDDFGTMPAGAFSCAPVAEQHETYADGDYEIVVANLNKTTEYATPYDDFGTMPAGTTGYASVDEQHKTYVDGDYETVVANLSKKTGATGIVTATYDDFGTMPAGTTSYASVDEQHKTYVDGDYEMPVTNLNKKTEYATPCDDFGTMPAGASSYASVGEQHKTYVDGNNEMLVTNLNKKTEYATPYDAVAAQKPRVLVGEGYVIDNTGGGDAGRGGGSATVYATPYEPTVTAACDHLGGFATIDL